MNAEDQTFVIVGAGLAGAKAAEALRRRASTAALVLIGDEPERPYERPPLSKDYLRGEAAGKPYVHAESFYAENEIELWTSTRVSGIDANLQELLLEGDRRLSYDRLLVATGARAPPSGRPGRRAGRDPLPTDPRRLGADRRADRQAGQRLVVVGSGWIGAEVAASARQKGCEVTMIEMASLPLERVLGPELGEIYLDLHRGHGVEFLPETTVDALRGPRPRSSAWSPHDGSVIETDFVVVGIGVAPRAGLVETAGVQVDNGVLVDEHLETSVPGVFAAGDVANAHHPFYGRHLRVEHWANALKQGPVAARAMLGKPASYDEIPYFFSDQYEARHGVPAASPPSGTRSSSAETSPRTSSLPSGSRTSGWSPG